MPIGQRDDDYGIYAAPSVKNLRPFLEVHSVDVGIP